MLTPAIIASIIKQYEEGASLFSTTPELITLLRNILKKPEYRNFQNSAETKLLQKEDLWQIISAWDKNENLFSTYTYQGNSALKNCLRIFKAFKNNQMLTEQHIDILYTTEEAYKFLDICVVNQLQLTDNTAGNAVLDFIIHRIKDREKWGIILSYLNTHKLLTLENLQKIEPHIDGISALITKNPQFQSRYGNEEKLANIIVENPQGADIITSFYLKNKWREDIGRLLEYILLYKINDEDSLSQLFSNKFINLLFAKNNNDRINDEDVVNFIFKNIKYFTAWLPIINFLRTANILNIKNLNKAAGQLQLISEAMSIDSMSVYHQIYQTVYDLMIQKP